MAHIRLEHVHVNLPIYDSSMRRLFKVPRFGRSRVGTQALGDTGRTLSIHALNDICLEIKEGERVCLIGHNGAGKTTLLRTVAGIYPASSGTIQIHGKLIAILSNSIALNADATGYENIKLVAELYDWPKNKVPRYIDEIEEFTELGDYLSLPIRIYSAGMVARLVYAMATQEVPDVLVVDEGIGAGDANFQEKAEARTKSFLDRSKIVLIATHSEPICRAICNRAVLLAGGRQVFSGSVDEALDRYASLR
jgi:ABC-2 type transport system ATP-binding protein/lipopolysaccharide transport system ATP-binding protein